MGRLAARTSLLYSGLCGAVGNSSVGRSGPTVLQLGTAIAHNTAVTHPVCKRRTFSAHFTLKLLLILKSDRRGRERERERGES